ncbi:MAG: DUF2089 domain-containing protein [Candidatus Aminicenantes bacterium]|nr:DUF2089 domain-containing protein [Candidatus Aminicenantes bacterium]
MTYDWQELTRLTRGAAFTVERIKLKDSGIALEGSFEPPPLAKLTAEDQLFVIAFIRSHGSIKEMESLFGVSYPTVKNRLNAIASLLPFIEVNPPSPKADVLDELGRGAITVDEALERLKG